MLYQLIRCNCPFHETVFRVNTPIGPSIHGLPCRKPRDLCRQLRADPRNEVYTPPQSFPPNRTNWTKAETTPPEILRRHYRRLARDIHPDKHPDNVEEATRRFQQVTEAYEAIATRLKL
ncbi:unnamed protein product [Cladocopium goreaui]|uniref:DnaJ homolog subfamily B member 3 (Spermatogenic cell-specific DNAJ homolog) n=1 Tax=Cladocopium goreaui TaxID=2562237 RepID=A0A9P1D2W9_9DINO|nr:unnamed protein product [Cladocopium goreaui]